MPFQHPAYGRFRDRKPRVVADPAGDFSCTVIRFSYHHLQDRLLLLRPQPVPDRAGLRSPVQQPHLVLIPIPP